MTDVPIVRMPPQSIDAEIAVLGGMMMDAQALSTVMEKLDDTAFYKEAHKKIFLAGRSLYERNEPVDILTMANELEKQNALESAGGNYYLTELVQRIPSAANVEYYCKIVLDKSILRKLINVSNTVQEECYTAGDEAVNIIDKAEQRIFALSENKNRKDFSHIGPVMHYTMEKIEGFHEMEGGITGVPTGFKELDNLLSGMQNSDLLILAARPSMGKTALALNIARHAAIKGGVPVGIFSLEMASYQLVMRMLCSEARVDSHKVRNGKLPDNQWQNLSRVAGDLADAPIYIDDTPGINIMELRSKARRLKIEHKVGLLVVDYLQLLRGVGRVESRQIEIAMISQSLKNLAKELDLPVLALSQLSRAVESRGGERRPMLSDLRESGAIEQDADVVMFIYRPAAYGIVEPELEKIAEVIVAKQRNGPTGTIELIFLNDYVQFADRDLQHSIEVPAIPADPF
ncbi:MAG TPA: replicative DNA helicase [bacterium]|nr:replicative DNA helicase [bacterium]HPN43109.1 replicative DNA helicase [bacterium]